MLVNIKHLGYELSSSNDDTLLKTPFGMLYVSKISQF